MIPEVDWKSLAGRRPCARPTKSGRPCKQEIGPWQIGCRIHGTEIEKALEDAFRAGQSQAWARAYEEGQSQYRMGVEWGKRQAHAETERQKNLRTHIGADQIVEVDRYAYRWSGPESLALGDIVLVPGNWVTQARGHGGPVEGKVTALGSEYQGQLSSIIGRVRGAA